MDFKIAGTQNGITGIQLDLKIDGISDEIIRATLAQSREARIEILRKMLTTISAPRRRNLALGPAAAADQDPARQDRPADRPGRQDDPRHPGSDRRRDRSRGRRHRDHRLLRRPKAAQQALRQVEALTASVQVGRIYDGRVTSVKDFGAFIEILPGKDGLVPHQRAVRRVRQQRGRRLQGGRRDAGQGHRHRRPGPRQAQPQGSAAGAEGRKRPAGDGSRGRK